MGRDIVSSKKKSEPIHTVAQHNKRHYFRLQYACHGVITAIEVEGIGLHETDSLF